MVQYVFTPWRDRQELLMVRQQFYPQHHEPPSTRAAGASRSSLSDVYQSDSLRKPGGPRREDEGTEARARQHLAVARVSMWMQRGSCPHLVESTALLTAAILSDQQAAISAGADIQREAAKEQSPSVGRGDPVSVQLSSSSYAARAAYSTAFSRFVTGLLDSHQDRQHKMSMYAIAKSVGLPATFVELRHQVTHEQLPSLTRLRATAKKALDWIWDYYWKHLTDTPEQQHSAGHDGERKELMGDTLSHLIDQYLEEQEAPKQLALKDEILSWEAGREAVLAALDALLNSTTDTGMLRGLMALWQEALSGSMDLDKEQGGDKTASPARTANTDAQALKAELAQLRMELKGTDESPQEQDISVDQNSREGDEEVEGHGSGWSRYTGDWTPKPIGMV